MRAPWEGGARVLDGTATAAAIKAELKERVGRLREAGVAASARAVGGAVARNPLILIRPCHRVVASTGSGGYAGGATLKRWLLEREAATASSLS